MMLFMHREMTYEELHKWEENLGVNKYELERKLTHIIAHKVLCVKNGIYFNVSRLSYEDFPFRNVRRYELVIETLDAYIEDKDITGLMNTPIQELLPIKSGRKVSAEESSTLLKTI